MEKRVRIAPSPTGDPHVGTVYIALFNLIFARHHGGKFILRIEDTDRTRSKPEYEQTIYEALKWCGIHWDEGPDIGGPYAPYRQSERSDIYQKYAQKLIDKGHAYKCFATSVELQEMREVAKSMGKRIGYDRRYRNLSEKEVEEREKQGLPYVVRLKVPLEGECEYVDAIKGRVTAPWADIDDQIILKSDGHPTYHLANVVDDHLMKITHVIRGDEWMSSTPKHILLYRYLDFELPTFMHMPLLLGADGKKLSKRKNPTSVFYFRDSGYLSEALVNFLTHMGYSMPDEKEIYSLHEITREFDLKRIGVSGAFFDSKKLDWVNQKYIINNIGETELWDRIKNWGFSDTFMKKLMKLVHTRIKTFSDFMALCDFFFINELPYKTELFTPKNLTLEKSTFILQGLLWYLEEKQDFSGSSFEAASHEVATIFEIHHKKIVIPILFTAIMGKQKGPPLFDSINLLGKERTRVRLLKSIQFLGGISNKKIAKLKKGWDQKDCKGFMSD